MHLTSLKSLISFPSIIPILPVTSLCYQITQLIKTNIFHVKQERRETEQTDKTRRDKQSGMQIKRHTWRHYNAIRLQRTLILLTLIVFTEQVSDQYSNIGMNLCYVQTSLRACQKNIPRIFYIHVAINVSTSHSNRIISRH